MVLGSFHDAEMALVTLASFQHEQAHYHSTAFSIASPFESQARAHLQCLARNQYLLVDAPDYSAFSTYFTCAFSG